MGSASFRPHNLFIITLIILNYVAGRIAPRRLGLMAVGGIHRFLSYQGLPLIKVYFSFIAHHRPHRHQSQRLIGCDRFCRLPLSCGEAHLPRPYL